MDRAWLYVPGSSPERFAKAEASGAHSVLFDLEDAVVVAAKQSARQSVADWLAAAATRPESSHRLRRWVRINNEDGWRDEDIDAVVPHGAAGLCLAKADSSSVRAADLRISAAERRHGLPLGSVRLMPLIESAVGLVQVVEIARSPRVSQLQLGEGDLAADLGVSVGPRGDELLVARSWTVIASAAAGLAPPVAPVSVEFHDLEALRASCRQLRVLGFGSRAAIHPAQVPVIDECFSATEEEIASAAALLRTFDASVEAGRGAFVGPDGRMVDEAMVRAARRVVGGDG